MSGCTSWSLDAEVREIGPTPTGWRQVVMGVAVSFVCSCGTTLRGNRRELPTLAAAHLAGVRDA
jgi:hypothetical protein